MGLSGWIFFDFGFAAFESAALVFSSRLGKDDCI